MDQITIPSYNATTGEGTLSNIAASKGVSIQDILKANVDNKAAIPDVNNPNLILAGAKLNIPSASVLQTTTEQRADTQDRQTKLASMTGQPNPNMTGASLPGATGPGGADLQVIGQLQDQAIAKGINPNGMDEPTLRAALAKSNQGGASNKDTNANKDTDVTKGGDTGDLLSDLKNHIDDIKNKGAEQIKNIQSTLQNLLGISDARAQQRIQSLMGLYDQRANSVRNSYESLGKAKDMADFRNGINRYTPAQGQGILTDNEVREQLALNDLFTKMNDAVAKAQSAQDANDTRAFNTAFDKVENINKDINTSINNLMKEANAYRNAETKRLADSSKENQTNLKNNLEFSKRVAPAISAALDGLKTDKEKKAFIEKYAKDNGLDPAVLMGDVEAYSQKQSNADRRLDISASKKGAAGSTGKPITSGKLQYTNDDLGQIENAFSKGATVDGKSFKARGAGGYVDAGLYKAMGDKWVNAGGLRKDFVLKFPPAKYIDPADNDSLPTYYRNNSKGAAPTVDQTINSLK